MKIKKVSRSQTEGWYNIYFDGKERRWGFTDQEIKDIDNDIEVLDLPKCEMYNLINDNGWYGFVNRKQMEIVNEIAKKIVFEQTKLENKL